MNILVVGVGYIGAVNAYMLSQRGFAVTVYDKDAGKQESLRKQSAIIEETDFDWGLFYKSISICNDPDFSAFDAVVICVNAGLSISGYQTDSVLAVVEKCRGAAAIPIIRSTLGPAEIDFLAGRCGQENFCYWPEFLREGSALADFANDPNFVYCSNEAWKETVLRLFPSGNVQFVDSPRVLPAVKVASNAFRAVKVAFANAVRPMIPESGEADEFLKIFGQLRGNCDHRYLLPGDPFGGFCLPKETSYLSRFLRFHNEGYRDIFGPILFANEQIIHETARNILRDGVREILVFHFPFKAGTDDLRDSPTLALAEILEEAGVEVFDGDGSSRGRFALTEKDRVEAIFLNQNSFGVGPERPLYDRTYSFV